MAAGTSPIDIFNRKIDAVCAMFGVTKVGEPSIANSENVTEITQRIAGGVIAPECYYTTEGGYACKYRKNDPNDPQFKHEWLCLAPDAVPNIYHVITASFRK